jgi:hypothetical protein
MSAQKKVQTMLTPAKQINDEQEKMRQKAEIDRMKKIISEKIKDPAMAKKAALIISEMLKKKP